MKEKKMANAKYENVTPKKASAMLLSNTNNYRKISKRNVEALKSELIAGEWLPTTQGIGFDTDGVLVDGQNRLTAIVESGITAISLVCYNLPPYSKNKIDVGRKRTLSDLTGLSASVISTMRVPFRAVSGNSNATISLTFMRKYIDGDLGKLAVALEKICSAKQGILNSGMRAGLIMSIMSSKISEEEGLDIFRSMAELRKNSKGVYLNGSFTDRLRIEQSFPLLLRSLIEKLRQGFIPIYNDKLGTYSDVSYDVRERASKIMFLAMQAFDNEINHLEEFVSPCYTTLTEILDI